MFCKNFTISNHNTYKQDSNLMMIYDRIESRLKHIFPPLTEMCAKTISIYLICYVMLIALEMSGKNKHSFNFEVKCPFKSQLTVNTEAGGELFTVTM